MIKNDKYNEIKNKINYINKGFDRYYDSYENEQLNPLGLVLDLIKKFIFLSNEQLGMKSQVLERNAQRFSEQLNPKGLVLDLIKKFIFLSNEPDKFFTPLEI